MGKRLRLEDCGNQEQVAGPQPGTEVKIAVDLSRSKWVRSSIVASRRSRPPQSGQPRMSIAKTRRRRSAHAK